jgi:hypothetical protein
MAGTAKSAMQADVTMTEAIAKNCEKLAHAHCIAIPKFRIRSKIMPVLTD